MSRKQIILPRHLSAKLHQVLACSRVVNLIGARQVGKTTLVRDILQTGKFISLDDDTILKNLEYDTWGQLQQYVNELKDVPLIIDEAQRSAKLPLAIKRIVDASNRKGQFILTGSSNIFRMSHVTDSLAGRVLTLTLWPMTVSETLSRGPSKILDWAVSDTKNLNDLPVSESNVRSDYIDLILKGGFPEIRELDLKFRQETYRDYVDSVVDRDVADIIRVRKGDALRRLIDQMAVRTGSELNIATLCRIIEVQRTTIEQYLDVLIRLSLLTKLGAWASGETRREIKNAKIHFADTGIAAALRNLESESFDLDASPQELGGLLESFVFSELLRIVPYQNHSFRFYHWRDSRGREIDILAEAVNKLVAIEVKASSSVGDEDFKHLNWFSSEGPGRNRNVTSIIFYLGQEKLRFGNNQYVLPVSCLWGLSKS